MFKFFSCAFLIFISSTVFSSTTIIKGNAKLFKGKEIAVYTYSDYITNTKEKIGFTTIKDDGKFSFQFDNKSIKKTIIKIEDKTTWFFTEPGSVYNINLSYDKDYNKGHIYDKQLSLKFNFPAPTELNQQVKKFNQNYDIFIEENKNLFEKRNREIDSKIEEFQSKMLKKYDASTKSFVKDYVNYSIASMMYDVNVSFNVYATKKNSQDVKAKLYLKYLNNKPIRYNNPEYMNFFTTFFKGEFKKLTLRQVKGINISNIINDNPDYNKLSKELSVYPFLKVDEFNKLFLINGLKEVYPGKYFNKKNIIKLLTTAKNNSKYPTQQIITTNIIKKLTVKDFAEGQKAPEFSLKNKEGKLVQLADFKGKPVYINFWTTWSVPSLKEMKIMQVLHKKYKGKIQFISICADNDFGKMKSFLKSNPTYDWTFLHIGNDKQLNE